MTPVDAKQRKALRLQRTALRAQLVMIGGQQPGELIEVRYRPRAGAGITGQKWFDAAKQFVGTTVSSGPTATA